MSEFFCTLYARQDVACWADPTTTRQFYSHSKVLSRFFVGSLFDFSHSKVGREEAGRASDRRVGEAGKRRPTRSSPAPLARPARIRLIVVFFFMTRCYQVYRGIFSRGPPQQVQFPPIQIPRIERWFVWRGAPEVAALGPTNRRSAT